jgi:hypothetical protein
MGGMGECVGVALAFLPPVSRRLLVHANVENPAQQTLPVYVVDVEDCRT